MIVNKFSIFLLFLVVQFVFICPCLGEYDNSYYINQFEKGYEAYSENDYENASSYFDNSSMIDEYCLNVFVYYMSGLTHHNLLNFNTSLDYFLKSESLYLQNNCSFRPYFYPSLKLDIGREYLLLGNYAKSEMYLIKANEQKDYLNTDSQFLLALLLGEIYLETGKYEKALFTYKTLKSNNQVLDEYLIQELDERINILEQLNSNDIYFKEDTIIFLNNDKIYSESNFTTNLEIPLSYVYYLNSVPPEIPEFHLGMDDDSTILSFGLQVTPNKNNRINGNVTDSEIIIYSVPLPNFVLSNSFLSFYGDDRQSVISLNSKPLYIDKYIKTVKIYDLDRYIGISSYFGEPTISYQKNRTTIQWDYNSIFTPKILLGVPSLNNSEFQLLSTGEIIVLLKPESQKHWSKETILINKPIEPENAPMNFAVYRHDTRFPKKSDTIIPLLLNTKSDVFIDYVKVGKKEYDGPIKWENEIDIENETYYTLESLENTTLVIFKSPDSESMDVEIKYYTNSSNYVTQLDKYSWNYNITYFYQVGDIADNKQTYTYVLPEGYKFQSYPQGSIRNINEDNLEQIILEYKVRERERNINFTIERVHEGRGDEIKSFLVEYGLGKILDYFVLILAPLAIFRHTIFKKIKKHLPEKYKTDK